MTTPCLAVSGPTSFWEMVATTVSMVATGVMCLSDTEAPTSYAVVKIGTSSLEEPMAAPVTGCWTVKVVMIC